jgi:hypothetical protein
VFVGEAALEFATELDLLDVATEFAVEELEAAVDVEGFEQLLLESRIFAEAEGGDIHKGLGIGDGFEKAG